MFGLVNCNATILARQHTDPELFFVRSLVKNWLWPIITFFGVTGNILAIIVLTKRRMIMSSTNNYLVALALVDIAYLLITLILNTSQNPCFAKRSISVILMIIFRPIADFSSNSSVWLTVTFTVERWVAITYPLQSRTWCTVHRARKLILSVLCASLICTLPSAFEVKPVRVSERKIIANQTILINRIEAKRTIVGESILYQRIYFNFVTFAIIWIPLLLLVIFNTVLISYVRRSKQTTQQDKEGIELRRHNRANQVEQRKTTIMLIAVVIVFTVCQIPQAISLTIQSVFPHLEPTPRLLIYNNFANCLVAVNASINFVLYCCFSDRFRSTFRSHFTFISKYCAQYIHPEWNKGTTKHSLSVDNISATNPLNTRISNISADLNIKYSPYSYKKTGGNRVTMLLKPKSSIHTLRPNMSMDEKHLRLSTSFRELNQPLIRTKIRPKSYSYRSLNETKAQLEPVWIKRHQSHSTIEQYLNQRKPFLSNEILDVTV